MAILVACQDGATSPRAPEHNPSIQQREAIEVRDVRSTNVIARVTKGPPCRATVDNVELIVGGRPLIAQYGDVQLTGEDAPNGTTLRQNGEDIARIHAK